jgi:cell division protein FtsB
MVTMICLVTVVSLLRSIYGLWRRRDIVKERALVLAQTEAENKRLKEDLVQVESPGFVEQEARNKLGLVKEGEKVVLLPQQSSVNGSQLTEKKDENLPNWKQWWKLFF